MSDTAPMERKSDPVISLCYAWHERLTHHPGDRAALRRCESTTAALMIPATHWLCSDLSQHRFRSDHGAALAALLAHCDSIDERLPLPEAMALGEPARVSALRFRRLLASDSIDELLGQLRRVIALLRKNVHGPSLINAIRYWRFETASHHDTRIIREWACAYFAKNPTDR